MAHATEDGLFSEEHIASALAIGFPLANSASVPTDVQQAVKFVPGSSTEDARSFWKDALRKLRGRAAELEGGVVVGSWR